MANTKSAAKQARVGERRRQRNKAVRSACRSNTSRAEGLVFSGDGGAADVAVKTAIRSLDKAAEKGIIHRNNAARRKSRLMKKLNKLVPPAAPGDAAAAA